ncbi:hypothetical protein PHSY_000929 [Pseudozyma hubeiensis SY62]|uniref:Uncharacterized protein n=1 Tax=Pseudozyma hubeiensis (strain SY62) TaxID=1305764 RepID=R9NXL9_PSEHS|nr:hypothetical protein PHSY_000929 [Pseudozyma hubeiensis SY62]GAC93364.1 hypothetical protein PHSY_000929 [Pseudozyma hubeiensis SY62]
MCGLGDDRIRFQAVWCRRGCFVGQLFFLVKKNPADRQPQRGVEYAILHSPEEGRRQSNGNDGGSIPHDRPLPSTLPLLVRQMPRLRPPRRTHPKLGYSNVGRMWRIERIFFIMTYDQLRQQL